MVTLDAETHVYRVNGQIRRGVTEILRLAGVTDFSAPWFTERSRDWGTNLDQCCSMIDTGTLDMDSVDERIRPEVEAYAAWREQVGGEVVASQQAMASSTYGFAGTLDVLLRWPSGRYALVDRKRGLASTAARLQTALYAVLVHETRGIPLALIDRYALDRMGSTTPTVRAYRDRMDISAALGAVALANWADNVGLTLTGAKHG